MGELPIVRGTRKASCGTDFQLGATLTAEGISFALFSRNAREVFLLLFDDPVHEPGPEMCTANRMPDRSTLARRFTAMRWAGGFIVDSTR